MQFLNIILFYVYINSASSQLFEEDKRFLVKQFPKKVAPGFFQINYSGKYVKNKHPYESSAVHPHRAFYEIPVSPKTLNDKYTAFVPMQHPYPDSLLFPYNPPVDQKPRVKKVLPDQVWSSLRKKRSAAQTKVESHKTGNKTEAKREKGVEKKGEKHDGKEVKQEKGVEKKEDKLDVKGDKHDVKEDKPDKLLEKKGDKHGGTKEQVENKGDKHNVKEDKHDKDLEKKGDHHDVKEDKHLKLLDKKGDKHDVKENKHSETKELRQVEKKGDKHGAKEDKHIKLRDKKDARRLISARDALIEQYPYVISIQKNDEHWCAGAILNPRLVITTANCLWKSSQISRLKVRVGSRYTNHGGQTFKIQEVMKHPGWKIRKNPDCDVALALLDKNIRFSHSVHSVDLPNIAMMPAFDDAWVVSWGSERRDGIFDKGANALQVFHVRLMDKRKCNNITRRFGVAVTENFICLAQTGRRAPCTRDTGAPAVSDGVLWGLASWGIRKLCGTERYPAMFSYLASPANIDFIANATHTLMSEQRHYPFPDRLPIMRASETTTVAKVLPDDEEDLKTYG